MPPKPNSRPTRVRAHRRAGVKVRSHNRQAAWTQARAAWVGTSISGLTTLALVLELGMTIIATLALCITALLGAVAVRAGKKANTNRAWMRSQTQARKKPHGRRPAPRKRTR